jgi:hypothetical protein
MFALPCLSVPATLFMADNLITLCAAGDVAAGGGL